MRSTCMVLELLIDEVLDVLKKYVSFGDDVAIEILYKQIFGDIIYKKLAELEMKFCQFVENVHR